MTDIERTAKLTYEAYSMTLGKSYTPWEELDETLRGAWVGAAGLRIATERPPISST